jgi:hypothetical protein
MQLQAGLRFGLGPRFHDELAWAKRLSLNSGVMAAGNQRLPRPDWRAATSAELELLLAGQGAGCWERDCCLLRFPEHLRRLWWDRAAAELLAASEEQVEYQGFLKEVSAFLQFKGVPLLPACRFDLLARPPGQSSALGPDSDPARLIALINLGDEATGVVLWDRPVGVDELDYPLVRMRLQPGDGCWLPAGISAWPADTIDKTDLDVLLVIREGSLTPSRQQQDEAR